MRDDKEQKQLNISKEAGEYFDRILGGIQYPAGVNKEGKIVWKWRQNMKDKEQNYEMAIELYKVLSDKCEEMDCGRNDILAFLSCTLTGTMEMYGASVESFDRTMDRMKELFREKRKERQNKEDEDEV